MARVGVESDEEQEEVGQHRHGNRESSRCSEFPVIAQNACSTFLHMLAHLRQLARWGMGGGTGRGGGSSGLNVCCVLSVISEIYQPPVDEKPTYSFIACPRADP